eukprot:jgi/Chrzof1/3205/Cz12g15230.t1_HO[v5.2]
MQKAYSLADARRWQMVSGSAHSTPSCTPRPVKSAFLTARPRVHVAAHGHATATTESKKQGFVGEMRKVAMKLHTRDQAPKEGGKEASKTPMSAWQPTREGYAQFLAESQAVYNAFEDIIQKAAYTEYAQFQNTGLERSAALQQDLHWFKDTYNITPTLQQDGPGMTYVQHIQRLAQEDPQAFICHYYNFYFAHTAGGRMIGSKVAGMILDGQQLKFYQWDGDVSTLLDNVRNKINVLAESWTPEQKTHCLRETEDTFKWSGGLLKCITGQA